MDSASVASIAVGLGARVTALLGLTLLALFALRSASAATRHLLAVSGLLGALALPVLTLVLPQWELAVLPASKVEPLGQRPIRLPALVREAPVFANARLAPLLRPLDDTAATKAAANTPAALAAGEALFEALPDSTWQPAPDRIGAARAFRFAIAAWVFLGWALVAGLLLARVGAGMIRLARLSRQAVQSEDAAWLLEVSRCSAELRLRRVVRLLHSEQATMPMTSGALDPVVMMPTAAHGWTQERKRLVLLHELAHVKRLDWLLLVLCEVAAALFWFHPLAWISLRAARREAENATDDLVLGTGARPSVYAGHLVDLIRSLRASPVATSAVPMARAADLEARLRALLGRRGRGPSSLLGRGFAVGLTALAVLFATVRPTQAAVNHDEDAAAAHEHGDGSTADLHFKIAAPLLKLAKLSKRAFLRSGGDFYSQGMEAHNDGRYREAIPLFQKAIEAGQREDAAAYNIACGYARLGETDQAFEWLRKAAAEGFDLSTYLKHDDDLQSLRRDPRFRDLKREAGQEESQADAAKGRRAVAKFDRLLAASPASADPWYSVGKELLAVKQYSQAARAFQQAAARSSRPANSLYNTACALALGGEKDGAFDFLAKAIDQGFSDRHQLEKDDDLDNLRDDRRFATLLENAEELALPSVGYSSSRWPFGTGRGEHKEAWLEASDRYAAYSRAHPDSGLAAYNLGYARLALGENSAAIPAFERALELGYRRSATLYNLACAEAKQDRKDRAFKYLDQAIEAGYDSASQLRSDEDLDNLRGDPRYRAAIRKAEERSRKLESAND